MPNKLPQHLAHRPVEADQKGRAGLEVVEGLVAARLWQAENYAEHYFYSKAVS